MAGRTIVGAASAHWLLPSQVLPLGQSASATQRTQTSVSVRHTGVAASMHCSLLTQATQVLRCRSQVAVAPLQSASDWQPALSAKVCTGLAALLIWLTPLPKLAVADRLCVPAVGAGLGLRVQAPWASATTGAWSTPSRVTRTLLLAAARPLIVGLAPRTVAPSPGLSTCGLCR